MREQQGFVFIITLCITTVMSLLLLSSLQNILLYQHAANIQEQAEQRFYGLEHAARHIISVPINSLSSCLSKATSPNTVIQYLLQGQGCSLRSGVRTYRYLIEDLGEHPCLVFRHKKNIRSTHHFLFSIISQADPQYPQGLVQIRVIKETHSLSCPNDLKYVPLGISSWRYLENIDLARYST